MRVFLHPETQEVLPRQALTKPRIRYLCILLLVGAVSLSGIISLTAQESTPTQEQALRTALDNERASSQRILIGSGAAIILFIAGAAFVVVKSRKDGADTQNALAATNAELAQTKSNLASTTQQFAEASQFRFQMLNIASHELRNPLVAIINFAELLNEPDMTPSERSVIIGQATGMAERALGLITSLLEAHRLEIGQVRAHIGNVSLLPVLHNVVETYRELAKHKSIIIFNEYPTNPGTKEILVQADETMMRQVLENVISNAVKFSPFGKTILIRVVEVDAKQLSQTPQRSNNQEPLPHNTRIQANKRIRVEVQDEGQGISPDDMKKMFGLFTRLSARPTGGESTAGVGLSIVKRMVESMNGRVWCESELGSGTTFVVEFVASDVGARAA